jgi:hypothetical protein
MNCQKCGLQEGVIKIFFGENFLEFKYINYSMPSSVITCLLMWRLAG